MAKAEGAMHTGRQDELADLAEAILGAARELHARPDAAGEAVRLTPTEAMVMRIVAREPGRTAGEIARAAGLQKSNLSPVLRGLEAYGLIARRQVAGERVVRIDPAPAAAAHLHRVRAEWGALLGSVLDDRSPHDALVVLQQIDSALARRRVARSQT